MPKKMQDIHLVLATFGASRSGERKAASEATGQTTRRTELDAQFPSYVVNEWLGHDTKTAEKHYQQVPPEHLSHATELHAGD